MSCFQFANGTIILPNSEYSKFVKNIHDKLLPILKTELAIYNNYLENFLISKKGKRNVDWNREWINFQYNFCPVHKVQIFQRILFMSMVYDYCVKDKTTKPKPLKESDIAKFLKNFVKNAKSTDSAISAYLSQNEASICFDKTNSSVSIHVSENNHSVDCFQNSLLWNTIKSTLNDVKWTKKTGGVILMNDEYNIEEMGGGYDFYRVPSTYK